MSNKREKDRESGTGQPIKSIPSKGGSGKGNWGSDAEQIQQGMDSMNNEQQQSNKRPRNEPNSFGDLSGMGEANKPKQSWDEFNKGKKKTEAYAVKSVKSDYRKKYKPNAYEKETDAMFAGTGKKRRRNKQKKKKKKVLLQTAVHYNEEKKSSRGRGRGSGGYNNMRGGGYRGGRGGGYNNQRGGGYGGGRGGGYGYNNQRGGYRRGGGFGSRGRGSFNNEYDNNQNYQNQNQYQPQSSNPQQPSQQQPPQQSNNQQQPNQDNVNIPVTVQ